MRTTASQRLTLAVVSVATAVACATPVGVDYIGFRGAEKAMSANAISSAQSSEESRQVLARLGLLELAKKDPAAALAELHANAVAEPSRGKWFALAELSFLYAEKSRVACTRPPNRLRWVRPRLPCGPSKPYFVAAAVYAWATLFPEIEDPDFDRLDPRIRIAADLYNLAITRALVGPDGEIHWSRGPYEFHLGVLDFDFDREQLQYAGRQIVRFQSTIPLGVRGLRNRYRFPGVGAPMAVTLSRVDRAGLDPRSAKLADGLKVPVTLLMRFEDPVRSLQTGVLRAGVEIHPGFGRSTTEIDGREVMLESEPSAALALSLEGASLWDFELAGYLSGDILPVEDGLTMMSPYVPGKIPLVLVHGTASSPARWAELINDLWADTEIREHYQVWLFTYTTGNPVLYSASLLRQSLLNSVRELDPDGEDPALQRMVIAGHSQGGLLTKLQVVDSGDRFWRADEYGPFEDLDVSPESREVLSSALFFERLPFVDCVIFISTPHRGSFRASGLLGRFAASLVEGPTSLVGVSLDLARAGAGMVGDAVDVGLDQLGSESAERRRSLDRILSSVDNMNPDSFFGRTLSSIPIEPPVRAYSIIPVLGEPPAAGQNDGVVEYSSAHIDEAETELVVYGHGHSVQSDPRAIQEVRRILLEHLATGDAGVAEAAR